MAFLVKKTYDNGYRCGCCRRDWESDHDWYESLGDALAILPVSEVPNRTGDGGLAGIEIVDGSTGEKIAWGQLCWPQGFGKAANYRYTCWRGFHPTTGIFEVIRGDAAGRTWDEILAGLREERKQADILQAQKDIEVAQKRLATLQSS